MNPTLPSTLTSASLPTLAAREAQTLAAAGVTVVDERAYLPVNRLQHDGTLWNW